jgi:hypothetical protein
MSCCSYTSNGFDNNSSDSITTNNLTVNNSAFILNETFHQKIGDTGSLIQVDTLNATNINGTITPTGPLLVKNVELNRDNISCIIGNNFSTSSINSVGLHIGLDSVGNVGSIYSINSGGTITDLYLNSTSTLGNGATRAPSFYTDSITEFTSLNGIQLAGGIKFLNNAKTIRNSVDDIILDANNATNNTIRLQSGSTDKFTVGPSQNTSTQNLIMGTNSINFGSGQCILNNNSLNMTSANFDAVRISTVGSGGTEWIGISAGLDGIGVGRVVIGNLNNVPTIGGHITNSSGGYISWGDLNINNAPGANVHIQNGNYTSANALSVGGSVDVQTGYKINNSCSLTYAGGSTVNNFVLPAKGSAGPWTIALTTDIPAVSYKETLFFTSNGALVNSWFFGPQGMTSAEANFSWVINKPATFNFLRVRLSTTSLDTYTFTVRVNGVDSSLSVAITNNTFGINLVSSVSVSAGDLYSVAFTNSSGTPPTALGYLSFDMTS